MTTQDLRLPPIRYLVSAALCFLGTIVFISSNSPAGANVISNRLSRHGDSSPAGWLDDRIGPATTRTTLASSAGSTNTSTRPAAAFVILARENDLIPILESIRQMEDRFNHKHHYDYVFLNHEPFTKDFKEGVSRLTSGRALFGRISGTEWSQVPDFIDQDKAAKAREDMAAKHVLYGDSVTYRQMCRYQSGFFWRHEMLESYDYYWRIEPGVKYFCDLDYDPFVYMRDHDKKYGWTISMYDYADTIPHLWDAVQDFMKEHPEHLAKDNLLDWISNDDGKTYNRCHFWSNFEIVDLSFYRSEVYQAFFDSLDRAGGFYYERWGDAPVHSIAAALLLPKHQVHFFSDIGYRNDPAQHCPKSKPGRCACNPSDSFDTHWYSCTPKYRKLGGSESALA